MRIPELQPEIPTPSQNAAGDPPSNRPGIGSSEREDKVRAVEYSNLSGSASPAGSLRSTESVDAVDLSAFSQILFTDVELASRVEILEKSYSAGTYGINPDELAHAIVQSTLALTDSSRGDSVDSTTQIPEPKAVN